MESDESQDASSANESDVVSHHSSRSEVSNKNIRRSSSRESFASLKSSRSGSQSSNKSSRKSSENGNNSNPPSPRTVTEQPESPISVKSISPKPTVEFCESSTSRLETLSPECSSNDDNNSLASSNSSRSSSPVQNNHNGNEDHASVKSDSSRKSPDKYSETSERSIPSRSSRDGRRAANLDDGNTSDSSISSGILSVDKKKDRGDVQTEEISDGDIDSDQEKKETEPEPDKHKETTSNINITHEDLSDVSDLEDSIDHSDYGLSKPSSETCETEDVQDQLKSKAKKPIDRTSRSEDGEEQLDFEAEDGECAEPDNAKGRDDNAEQEAGEIDDDVKRAEKIVEELEEGELTDEDDVRPEETEPRPVCRFFSRGQCTWGASCRFLHPGVTDKGNYTMFELVRPVVPGDYGNDRMAYGGRTEPAPIESAWERGLRTAKEMMRKSIKRKEQDIDFEEKKMNLSLAQEEFDKENGYYGKAPSPEPSRYVAIRHPTPVEYAPVRLPPEEYYGRRQIVYEPEYTPVPPRERFRTFREVPPHRPPPEYYNKTVEEEPASINPSKAKRPKREVIVQRVEERAGRGDEWSDPWMRSKSPAGGRKGSRRRSYSSGSSYSSSSSSASSKSSYRSRSRSSNPKKHSPRTHKRQVSPSVIVSERKAANERAALMNPPAPRKKAPSPSMMRLGAQNPPAPPKVDQFGRTRSKLAVAAALARVKGRTRSSRSSSGSSSGSSSSESDSSGSSSSSSRNGSPSPRRPSGVDLAMALKVKAIDALKSGSEKRQIKLNLKNSAVAKKSDFSELARKAEITQSRKRLAVSPSAADPKGANKKASSRREELLKQLKAVEDAIAKKRSKV